MPSEQNEIYLDNAATTKPYPEVIETIASALDECYGNPSSSHKKGRQAKEVLERSRQTVADALGVKPGEVYFTSGGTESNNLAVAGACLARGVEQGRVVTSSLEHPSMTKTVRNLKRGGWHIDYIDAKKGAFDLDALSSVLCPATTLISVMSVQNELGYRFPLEQIAALRTKAAPQALVHTDAVQAFCKLPLLPHKTGIDLASLSAHKIGGPKGVGALYVKRGITLFTTAFGGGQERGLRSGTEALPLIAGFAKAVEISMATQNQVTTLVSGLKRYLEDTLRGAFEDVIINSREDGSPYIVSFAIPGIDNKKALQYLSEQGIYISTASACESNHATVSQGTWRSKHPLVLQLAGIPKKLSRSVFRVSFFAYNTQGEIDQLVALLRQAVDVP
jgi:cysteine desulfurase